MTPQILPRLSIVRWQNKSPIAIVDRNCDGTLETRASSDWHGMALHPRFLSAGRWAESDHPPSTSTRGNRRIDHRRENKRTNPSFKEARQNRCSAKFYKPASDVGGRASGASRDNLPSARNHVFCVRPKRHRWLTNEFRNAASLN